MALFGPNVDKLKKKGDIEGLVDLLNHKDMLIRWKVAAALFSLDDPRLVTLLMSALEHPVAGGPAAEVVANRTSTGKDDVGVPELMAVLEGQHPGFRDRVLAAEALMRLGDPAVVNRAIEPLVACFIKTRMEPKLRKKVASALDSVDSGLGSAIEVVDVAKALVKLGDESGTTRARSVLIERLKEDDSSVRREAATALGQIGTSSAVDALLATIQDGDHNVKRAAEAALTQMGAPAVRATLQGREVSANLPAFTFLAEMGDTAALDELIAVLLDDSQDPETLTKTARHLHNFQAWHGTDTTRGHTREALRTFRSKKVAIPFLTVARSDS